MSSIFSCAYWSTGCRLWRNVYLGLLPIFWLPFFFVVWLLSYMNCVCILEIKLLSVTLFANTSSKSTGSFFVLFMISFGGSDGKQSACNARDLGSIPELGRSPGGEHGNSCPHQLLILWLIQQLRFWDLGWTLRSQWEECCWLSLGPGCGTDELGSTST